MAIDTKLPSTQLPAPIPLETNTETLVGLYTMFYRQHTNHLVSKNFRHHGDLRSARARAEKHCDVIGAKLNFVQPLISDLEKEEKHFFGFLNDSNKD